MTVKNIAIRYSPRGEEAVAAHWLVGFDEEKAPQWNTLLDFKNQERIEKDFFRLNENSLSFHVLELWAFKITLPDRENQGRIEKGNFPLKYASGSHNPILLILGLPSKGFRKTLKDKNHPFCSRRVKHGNQGFRYASRGQMLY